MNRISYFVCRISREKEQREKNVGFEADPNASGGGRMSEANDSEGGRLRRRSGTTGEKEYYVSSDNYTSSRKKAYC